MSYLHQRALLRDLFDAAVGAADPAHCLAPWLPDPPKGRTVVVGAGKGAAAMARAVETHWRGDVGQLSGIVVTRYGHGVPTSRIEVVEAAHPTPDAAGQKAAQRLLQAVQGLGADDLVLVLLSGGGSALLAAPIDAITLDEKRALTKALLACGANIAEINCVRKHLSTIKGGRLALAAAPARVVTLAISDVPGDDLSTIASGPTVPDSTTCADALEVVDRYGIALPAAARAALESGATESPKPGDPSFARCESHIVATAQASLAAAAELAR
nr:glycerate-2-kinase family protein [Sulfuritalea sp.]